MTTTERTKRRELRDDAISQIEKRFTTSKKVKIGVQKPGYAGVYATKVFDFIPNVKLLVNKTALVQCDDVIEKELSGKQSIGNNDFMLHQFKDSQAEDTKLQLDLHRSALYKFYESQPLPREVLRSLQGDKRVDNTEVDRAVCFEHVRDFVLNKVEPHEQQGKDLILQANDFLVMASKSILHSSTSVECEPVYYIPITSKISL
jgi:hypothetical protein